MKHLRLKVMYSGGWWNLLMSIAHSDEPSQRNLPGFPRHLQMVSSLFYVRICPNVVLTVEVMTTQIKQPKAIYSKLAISRKPTCTNWIWQRLKTVRRMVQLCSEKKEDVGYALIRDCWQGNVIRANWLWGIKCDRLGVHIWLSFVDLILEAVQKLGKLSVINQALDVCG